MNSFNSTILLQPYRSRIFGIAVNTVFASMALVLLLLPLSKLVLSIILLCFCLLYVNILRTHVLRSHVEIRSLELRSDQSCLLELANGQFVKAELLSGSLVLPWLTVLNFKLPDQNFFERFIQSNILMKHSLILLKDNVDPNAFRRCRVRLLHRSVGDHASSGDF